jgi:hypothetical protein
MLVEALECSLWRTHFGRGFRPVVKIRNEANLKLCSRKRLDLGRALWDTHNRPAYEYIPAQQVAWNFKRRELKEGYIKPTGSRKGTDDNAGDKSSWMSSFRKEDQYL